MVEHVGDMAFFWKDVLGNVQVLLCSFSLTETEDGWSRPVSFASRKKQLKTLTFFTSWFNPSHNQAYCSSLSTYCRYHHH
jgi:hypothetical protein